MIRRLWALYRPYRGWLALGAALALLTTLANLGLLALSGWFITSMGLAGVAGVSMDYFTPAAMIRGLAILRTGGRYGERVVSHEATFRLIASLRVWFYARLEPLAPAVLQTQRSGELLSRLHKDIDRLDAVYLRIALPLITAAVGTLLVTAFMALHNVWLALINFAFLLLGGLLLPLWVNRLASAAGRQQVQLSSKLRSRAIESVQGMAELIAFDADGRAADALRQGNADWLAQQDRLNRIHALSASTQLLLAQLAMCSVTVLAVVAVRQGELPPANLAMLALLSLASFELIAPLPNALGLLGETAEAFRRVFGMADAAPAVVEPANPIAPPATGSLVVDQVSLRYPGQPVDALTDVSLTLPAGSRTLLLGASGAGKSSLIQLLLRFRTPSAGSIRYAGHDLAEFDGESWRARIAVVSQHTQLINASLRDNLRLARPNASDAELLAACERAQIRSFVEQLPEGLNSWLGETGTRLSGGQARRIAIARAVLKDAPLLLLDEPTEGLDRLTQDLLMEALRDIMVGRTVLLITHRPLDIGALDQTIRLDRGQRLSE